jgi:hypothetical protein
MTSTRCPAPAGPGSRSPQRRARALTNALARTHGGAVHLLRLALPAAPLPPPVRVPAVPPRLPPIERDAPDGATLVDGVPAPAQDEDGDALSAVRLAEADIQETARFVREFAVQHLIPWMEKSVAEWNENVCISSLSANCDADYRQYSSTRRLPSRLFSSTRRLFGTGYGGSATPPPAAPTHQRSSTFSQASPQSFGSESTAGLPGGSGPGTATGVLGEARRLAEFATVLGDYKLAVSVWDSLRKDGRGADVLPLVLAPATGVAAHVQAALAGLGPPSAPGAGPREPPPAAQLAALVYAARWAAGIAPVDFAGDALRGEQWLVWAAGNVRSLCVCAARRADRVEGRGGASSDPARPGRAPVRAQANPPTRRAPVSCRCAAAGEVRHREWTRRRIHALPLTARARNR